MRTTVGARPRPSGPGHARLVGAVLAVVLGAVFAQSPAGARAQGIAPFDCSGDTIYQIQRAESGSTTGRLNAIDVTPMVSGYRGPVTAAQATTSVIPATNPGANALGITEGGEGAWAVAPQSAGGSDDTLTFDLWSFDPATNEWTSRTASINTANRLPDNVTAAQIRGGSIVAGAIDPYNHNFYWAYLSPGATNRTVIFGWDVTENRPIGVVAFSRLPQFPAGTTPSGTGANGDIAFDGAGNLYVLSNSGTHAAVGVISRADLPSHQQPTTDFVEDTQLTTFSNPNSHNYNGIAFNSVGELFIQWAAGTGNNQTTTIEKISPQPPGTLVSGPSTVNFVPAGGANTRGVDLGSCAVPPSLELGKYVVNRRAHTDQFHLSITGGAFTAESEANTGTTEGHRTGLQDQTAGPVVARAGTTYTFRETYAGTTHLSHYTTTWSCVDRAANNRQVDAGDGREFTLTPAPGQAIFCTFRNILAVPPVPNIRVVKTGVLDVGADGIVNAGDIIRYKIEVTNTGNVTLRDVTVRERDLAGMSAIVCPPNGTNVVPTLAPGEPVDCTATYPVTQADIDTGNVPNFATATGTPPQGDKVTDGDDEDVPLTAVPRLKVEKTGRLDKGADGVTNVGDTINYTIKVTNVGTVPLTNVGVTDTLLSPVVCPPNGTNVIPALAVSQSETCTATHRLTHEDIHAGYVPNFATATGTPPRGPDVTAGDDEVVRITGHPGIHLVKTGKLDTGADNVAGVGDVIHYTIRVRNAGNVVLRNVRVVEQNLAGLSAINCGGGTHVIATLRVGHTVTCTATYTVTEADVAAGFVPNFATATGTPPHGPDVTAGDDEVVPVAAVPELNVNKTGRLSTTGANGAVGDVIHYTIRVRNAGNVVLRNVRVVEQNLAGLSAINCGGGTHVIATLRVGQSVRCTATYRVTRADVARGFVPNFVTATGTPPRGPDVTDGDNHTQPTAGLRAVIALHKTARPSTVSRGSTVRFRLRVVNTSRVAAQRVRVCDTRPRGLTVVSAPGFRVRGRTACKVIGTLNPGASRTLVFTARVAAGAASRLTNIATATASNAGRVRARARVSVVRPPQFTG